MAKKMTMHVITGTHWDREWRHTAEQSKLRLMDLIDSILDILDKDPEYNSFILDGGTIVLEDYFTVRPEMKEKVKSLIEAKKLFIVSWYTLPETYTVAPESLIRNLQMGTEMAKEYGVTESEFLRRQIRQRPSDYPEIKLLMGHLINEINHVGVNINQIVKRNNAGFYNEGDKVFLEAYMRKICDELHEALEKMETGKFGDE